MFHNPFYGNAGWGNAVTSSLSEESTSYDEKLKVSLKPGWSLYVNQDGRIVYCNHGAQTSSWLPPAENWDSYKLGMPYGWEAAVDKDGKYYYINHVNKTTTYEDPRLDFAEEPPQPRDAELTRDVSMGFGFVAGSEKPVIVRFVTEGGPSEGKLLPGDQIWKINGEDVRKAPRDHVIQLVRCSKGVVYLTVCQPPLDNSTRKSALLSAAKKAKLRNHPSRVRFAEGVVISSPPEFNPSNIGNNESCMPFMPNVLKVFLENGQTKSFKYDSTTIVKDVLSSLQEKLSIERMEHFSLVVEHTKSPRRNKMTLLDPKESLARIAAKPGAQHLRCLFRVTFMPKDAYELLKSDPVAFDYLYVQSCNDVVYERFAPELKYDVALKLAAFHIQQHGLSNKAQGKLTIKTIEKEFGLEKFVPVSLIETMKRKELRKLLNHFLKVHQHSQKQQTALTLKLQYLKIIAELPSYGAKCFSITMKDSSTENVLLIGPKYGISLISSLRSGMPSELCDLETLTSVKVSREDEVTHRVELRLKDPDRECLVLYLEDRDADELLLVLHGYYRLFVNRTLIVEQEKEKWTEDSAPPYHTQHKVTPASWSYVQSVDSDDNSDSERLVDLAMAPPYKTVSSELNIQTMPINGHAKAVESKVSSNHNKYSTVDRNMNRTNQNAGRSAVRNNNQIVPPSNNNDTSKLDCIPSDKLGFDIPSVVSMEILEQDVDVNEAKNDEVIKRVVQMTRLVQDAEHYLTDQDEDNGDSTDPSDTQSVQSEYSRTESECSGSFPRIKHSDSLLLLTQGQRHMAEAVNKVAPGEMIDGDPSESDTDSLGTPNNSPSHRSSHADRSKMMVSLRSPQEMKHGGSSFGLHSPVTLPDGIGEDDPSVLELIQRLKEDSVLPCSFAEGTFILDPDMIDLTMIPPPITPDDDGVKYLPNIPSMPPTPFADRLTLEAELKAFQNNLGELRDLGTWDHDIYCDSHSASVYSSSSSNFAVTSDNEDSLSLSSLCDSTLCVSESVERGSYPSNDPSSAWSHEIDSFIANVTVPPPPSEEEVLQIQESSPVTELTQDQISAFIIPPPPSSYDSVEAPGTNHSTSNEDKDVERDRALGEVRIASEKLTLDLDRKETMPPGSEHVLTIRERKERLRNALNSNGCELFSLADFQSDSKKPPDYPPPPAPRYTQTLGRLPPTDLKNAQSASLQKSSSQNDISISEDTSTRGHYDPHKRSPTSPSRGSVQSSSNDSLSSSASIVTVKSKSPPLDVDPREDEGPPLPPKKSPNKTNVKPPIPPPTSQESSPKPIKSSPPSLRRDPGSPKPALPSRLRKPNVIPVKSSNLKTKQPISPPTNALGATGKPAAPPPTTNDTTSNSSSPKKIVPELPLSPKTSPVRNISGKAPVKIPSPTKSSPIGSPSNSCPSSPSSNSIQRSGSKLPRPRELVTNNVEQSPLNGKFCFSPPQTSSPRMNFKLEGTKLQKRNGVSKRILNGLEGSELNDSMESGGFEQDSLESSFDSDSRSSPFLGSDSRISPFVTGELRMDNMMKHLDVVISSEGSHQNGTHNPHVDQEKFMTAKDLLTAESRQFVTASKLFVKSATESEALLTENLELCLKMMERMMHVTELALTYTPTPVQTLGVADKVRSVGAAYKQTLRAASQAVGKDMNDASMGTLMEEATNLATVLTTLVRNLKMTKS